MLRDATNPPKTVSTRIVATAPQERHCAALAFPGSSVGTSVERQSTPNHDSFALR
jgi:hypothetical protein